MAHLLRRITPSRAHKQVSLSQPNKRDLVNTGSWKECLQITLSNQVSGWNGTNVCQMLDFMGHVALDKFIGCTKNKVLLAKMGFAFTHICILIIILGPSYSLICTLCLRHFRYIKCMPYVDDLTFVCIQFTYWRV